MIENLRYQEHFSKQNCNNMICPILIYLECWVYSEQRNRTKNQPKARLADSASPSGRASAHES